MVSHPTYAFMAFRYLYYWHLNFILDGVRLRDGSRIGDTNATSLKSTVIFDLVDELVNMLSDVGATSEKVEIEYLLVLVNGVLVGGRETLDELTIHREYW